MVKMVFGALYVEGFTASTRVDFVKDSNFGSFLQKKRLIGANFTIKRRTGEGNSTPQSFTLPYNTIRVWGYPKRFYPLDAHE